VHLHLLTHLCSARTGSMADHEADQPQSPPLSALIISGADLSLLDESDDLLSPSILGTAAACRVRAAHSPTKLGRRSHDRQPFGRAPRDPQPTSGDQQPPPAEQPAARQLAAPIPASAASAQAAAMRLPSAPARSASQQEPEMPGHSELLPQPGTKAVGPGGLSSPGDLQRPYPAAVHEFPPQSEPAAAAAGSRSSTNSSGGADASLQQAPAAASCPAAAAPDVSAPERCESPDLPAAEVFADAAAVAADTDPPPLSATSDALGEQACGNIGSPEACSSPTLPDAGAAAAPGDTPPFEPAEEAQPSLGRIGSGCSPAGCPSPKAAIASAAVAAATAAPRAPVMTSGGRQSAPRTPPRSPALAAMQASRAAEFHFDSEVRLEPFQW